MKQVSPEARYAEKVYGPGELPYDSKGERIRLEKIKELVGSGKTVLDLGCYDGILGKTLIDSGNLVYGIEINKEAACRASDRGLKVTIQDLTSRLEFADNVFDVVVGGEIIEHVVDTDSFIDEIKRILTGDGELILSTPNVASLGRRLWLLIGKNPYFEASYGYPEYAHAGHVRFFTRNLLVGYLRHKGFEIMSFSSDVVNIGASGVFASAILARIFPTLGRSLIVKARLEHEDS